MFAHVPCDEVRDIFEGVNQNIATAAQTLIMIYGEAPEDLSHQFRVIDGDGEGTQA